MRTHIYVAIIGRWLRAARLGRPQRPPQGRASTRSPARARYIDDLSFPGLLHARTIRSTIPAGEIAGIRFDFDTARLHHRRLPRHPRPEHRRADRRRPAVPGRADDPPRRRADPAARARGSRARCSPPTCRSTTGATTPDLRSGSVDDVVQDDRDRQRRSRRRASRPPTSIVEGEYRTGHQEQLYIEPNGVIAVPGATAAITVYGSLQCPYYVHRALKVLLGLPDDKVRVVQTETGGGFGGKEEYPSMIAGHAALLALKSRPAGEARLRPRRGHARDDQAPSGDRPAPHRRHARRPADGDGHRRAPRRRRLRDAERRRAVARRDPRHRAVPLRPRPHPRPRDDDQHAAQRRVPRLRRAADAVRRRSAHGPHRRGSSGSIRCACARSTRCGPATRRPPASGSARDCSALQVLREAVEAHRLQAAPHARWPARNRGHRPVALLPRLRLHRRRRGEARVEGVARAHRARRAHPRRRAPRSARARARCTRRSWRTRSACRTTPSRSTPPTPARCPTAGRPSPRAPAWSSAGSCSAAPRRCASGSGALTPREYLRQHGPLVDHEGVRAAGRDRRGTTTATAATPTAATAGAATSSRSRSIRDTWQVTPIAFTTVHEIGKAIHPMLARGPDRRRHRAGPRLRAARGGRDARRPHGERQLTNYIIPTTLDTPPIDVVMLENPYQHGPFGAKGVGEMPIDGPAPAVVNALRHAGFDVRRDSGDAGTIMAASTRRHEDMSQCHVSERQAARDVDVASDEAAARRAARGLRAHRHQGRLRRRRVRRVHGAARRRAGELVPRARGAGRRRARDDDRGARRAPSAAARVRRARRRAVRHLHARDDHGGRRARAEADARRRCATGLAGNLCRCTGYAAIYRAIREAGDERRRPTCRTRTRSAQTGERANRWRCRD